MAEYTRKQAIADLQRISYTKEEAERTLDEPDENIRQMICLRVQKRVREEQGK